MHSERRCRAKARRYERYDIKKGQAPFVRLPFFVFKA
jgi:hypothetical protein